MVISSTFVTCLANIPVYQIAMTLCLFGNGMDGFLAGSFLPVAGCANLAWEMTLEVQSLLKGGLSSTLDWIALLFP